MKDEIKEILDKLKDIHNFDYSKELDNECNILNKSYDIYLSKEETDKLLDCITNLQEKVNQYENPDDMTLMFMWCDEKAKDKIKQLQEENERLKETNVYCNRTDCSGRIKDSRKYDSVYQEKEDYKSRNEKAIEYIERCRDYHRDIHKEEKIFPDEITSLLMILQGEDKDE